MTHLLLRVYLNRKGMRVGQQYTMYTQLYRAVALLGATSGYKVFNPEFFTNTLISFVLFMHFSPP